MGFFVNVGLAEFKRFKKSIQNSISHIHSWDLFIYIFDDIETLVRLILSGH